MQKQPELVHPDHFCYYSPTTLARTTEHSGFTVEKCVVTAYERVPKDKVSRIKMEILAILNRIAYRISPYILEDVIAICSSR